MHLDQRPQVSVMFMVPEANETIWPLGTCQGFSVGFSHRQIRQLDNTHNGEVYLSSPSMILLIRIHVHGPQHEPSGAAK